VEKTAFELKANVTRFETGASDGGLISIGDGDTYVTADPNDIGTLRDADHAVKEVPVPGKGK
jgi:hypothetical protein